MDKPIQLRDGGRFERRDGKIVRVYSFPGITEYKWVSDTGHTYIDYGVFNCHRNSGLDLIAEVTDDKDENNVDFMIEVGKFYKDEIGQKWECLHIHNHVAFMVNLDNHHVLFDAYEGVSLYENEDIIGPWVEPLEIKWEMVPQYYDRILVSTNWCVYAYAGEQNYEGISVEWADHIAPGWREHIGETHYRDGLVERSKE